MYLTVLAIFLLILNPASSDPIALVVLDLIYEVIKFIFSSHTTTTTIERTEVKTDVHPTVLV